MPTDGALGIGAQLREFRRQHGLTQKALARACEVSPGYIALIETGKRRPDLKTVGAICHALSLDATQSAEIIQLSGRRVESVDLLSEVCQKLWDAQTVLGASSCLFYVRDPYWPEEFRLVGMHGVRIEDPMFGFMSSIETKELLTRGEDESFCEDAPSAQDRRGGSTLQTTIPSDIRHLFGDFVEREAIRSSARLFVRCGDTVEAILFVNFDSPTKFESQLIEGIRRLREDLAADLGAVIRAIRLADAPLLQETIGLLRPTQEWAASVGEDEDALDHHFQSVLDAAMQSVGMDTSHGFGTIHLYHAESEMLVLAAYRGSTENVELARRQSVKNGEGIISWVALRHRALIVRDFAESAFSQIHIPLKDGIRSELAVPMLAGTTLLGVLNLESTIAQQFDGRHVRPLWYAASNAAVAVRLFNQSSANRDLAKLNAEFVDCFCSAVTSGREKAVQGLSYIACKCLKASHCDIWRFDPDRSEPFDTLDASYYLTSNLPPRKGGWSDYVCRTGSAVWIENIKGNSRFGFSSVFWSERLKAWERVSSTGTPASVNERVLALRVGCELGIPILKDKKCLGIVWLKFDDVGRPRPNESEMLLVMRFAEAAAGLLNALSLRSSANA